MTNAAGDMPEPVRGQGGWWFPIVKPDGSGGWEWRPDTPIESRTPVSPVPDPETPAGSPWRRPIRTGLVAALFGVVGYVIWHEATGTRRRQVIAQALDGEVIVRPSDVVEWWEGIGALCLGVALAAFVVAMVQAIRRTGQRQVRPPRRWPRPVRYAVVGLVVLAVVGSVADYPKADPKRDAYEACLERMAAGLDMSCMNDRDVGEHMNRVFESLLGDGKTN